jgi:hypothetical protein
LTQTAPLIISTQASTSVPSSKTNRASPLSSAGIIPSPAIVPVSFIAHQAARP